MNPLGLVPVGREGHQPVRGDSAGAEVARVVVRGRQDLAAGPCPRVLPSGLGGDNGEHRRVPRADRRRSARLEHGLDGHPVPAGEAAEPGDARVWVFVGQVVEIDVHRDAAGVGLDLPGPDHVLCQFAIAAGQEPELAGRDGARDVVEKVSLLGAQRREIVQKLPHFRQDALGIVGGDERLEREAQRLHRLTVACAQQQLDGHLRAGLDAEVGHALLRGLGDATFVEGVSDPFENVRAMFEQPGNAFPSAFFLIGRSQEDDVVLRRAVHPRQIGKGQQLADPDPFHVERAPPVELIQKDVGRERRARPAALRGRNDVDVIEEQKAAAVLLTGDARVDAGAAGC